MNFSDNNDSFHSFSSPDSIVFTEGSTTTNETIDLNMTEEFHGNINIQGENKLIRSEDEEDKIILTKGKAFLSYLCLRSRVLHRTPKLDSGSDGNEVGVVKRIFFGAR
jgi:hypothetical protein